jgi:hypothetical protein
MSVDIPTHRDDFRSPSQKYTDCRAFFHPLATPQAKADTGFSEEICPQDFATGPSFDGFSGVPGSK